MLCSFQHQEMISLCLCLSLFLSLPDQTFDRRLLKKTIKQNSSAALNTTGRQLLIASEANFLSPPSHKASFCCWGVLLSFYLSYFLPVFCKANHWDVLCHRHTRHRPRAYTSKVGDEKLNQISKVIRYQGRKILPKLT